MKIVLVRPNFESHVITPPLGLGYLSSYLQKYGIEVVIIDGLRDRLSNHAIVKRILTHCPDAVGITCLTAFYHEVVALSLALKELHIITIIGGVHPTFLPFETLKDSRCDYIVRGEGEIALLKLAQNNLINNNITGVYASGDFKDDHRPLTKGECITDLDLLPFPDWKQIDPTTYPKAPHGALIKQFPVAPVMTTRGCPYACTFCTSPAFYNQKIRFRSPENVIREIQLLTTRFGVRGIHFEDDNLTLCREHIENICNLIIQNRIKISWACPNGIRADKVDEALIKLMKKSGCYYFAYGIESANQDILYAIKKQETLETINQSITLAARNNISCQGFFIFGLPGENQKTILNSIRFARKSKLARAQFSILDILPGSELWKTYEGTFEPNWSKKSFKEPEWIPAGLTREILLKSQVRAFREFYLLSPFRLIKLLLLVKPGQISFLLQRLLDYRIIRLFSKKAEVND